MSAKLLKVSAGFPSPADDYVEKSLDLNQYLVTNPPATFFIKAEGNSMIGAGVHSGDILIIDRSLSAENGKVIVGAINGELTLKRFQKKNERVFLFSENKFYKPIEITPELDFSIWGVATYVIHPL